MMSQKYDVLVVGGGNAALCAAISARQTGASVLVLEAATKFYRGGNTRHTRNMRCAHDHATDTLTGPYTEDEFWEDLKRVTQGHTDEELARFMIAESKEVLTWIGEQGVRFQPSIGGTLSLGRTNSFFLGGGRAMLNALYRTAESMGVEVRYESEVIDLEVEDGFFRSATVRSQGGQETVHATALVTASGGFESNIEWLKEGWGDIAENFLIRGTPNNRGTVLRKLLDNEVMQIGDPTQCHAVAIDARAPKYDGGIITRLDCVVFGIVVNENCQRFYDEGEDIWPSAFPPIKADSIDALAREMTLDPQKLTETVQTFNAAVQPGTFNHADLDNCHTDGIEPRKSNWARRIEQAPFYAYPVRPGITFTYLGVKVNKQARMIMKDGKPAANMFAAGEIMAGNVLGRGYAAGIGMTIGSVFGRLAGRGAARYARN
jgi:tricarballylate dehydrogenase